MLLITASHLPIPVTAWSLYSIKSLSFAHFSRHCAFLGSVSQCVHRTLQSFYFSPAFHIGDHVPPGYSKRAGGFDSAQGHLRSPDSWSHLCLPGWGFSEHLGHGWGYLLSCSVPSVAPPDAETSLGKWVTPSIWKARCSAHQGRDPANSHKTHCG